MKAIIVTAVRHVLITYMFKKISRIVSGSLRANVKSLEKEMNQRSKDRRAGKCKRSRD
jgi:hypothetical protein